MSNCGMFAKGSTYTTFLVKGTNFGVQVGHLSVVVSGFSSSWVVLGCLGEVILYRHHGHPCRFGPGIELQEYFF